MKQKIKLPYSIKNGKKDFIVNLNNFIGIPNRHVQSNIKHAYTKQIFKLVDDGEIKPYDGPIKIDYEIFMPDANLRDMDNIGALHAKFFQDALNRKGIIIEDGYQFIARTSIRLGGISYGNPYVMATIEPDLEHDAEKMLADYTKEYVLNALKDYEEYGSCALFAVAIYDYLGITENRNMTKKKIAEAFNIDAKEFTYKTIGKYGGMSEIEISKK